MLWYKSWLETRWRFVVGLILLMLSACSTVFVYPQVVRLLPVMESPDTTSELGRRVAEAMELARDYRGYVWAQWFRQNMLQMWAVFAVLLGTGGLLAQTSGGGTLFTLSLPVTRHRLVSVRAATGLAELLVLALVPSLVLPVLSPLIGQTYGFGDALVHSLCMFVACGVFFSFAFLMSSVFSDVWRPLVIVFAVAVVLGLLELFQDFSSFTPYPIMSAESYFRVGELPFLGLLVSTALSVSMLYTATKNIARQDF